MKQPRSTRVAAQQSSHALGDQERILFAFGTGGLDLEQPLFDALLKARMHRLFLLLSLRAAAKNEHFGAMLGGTQAHLQPSMYGPPILGQQLPLITLEHAL